MNEEAKAGSASRIGIEAAELLEFIKKEAPPETGVQMVLVAAVLGEPGEMEVWWHSWPGGEECARLVAEAVHEATGGQMAEEGG